MRVPPPEGDFSSHKRPSSSPTIERANELKTVLINELGKFIGGHLKPEGIKAVFNTLTEKLTDLMNLEKKNPWDFSLEQRHEAEEVAGVIQNMKDQIHPPTDEQINHLIQIIKNRL